MDLDPDLLDVIVCPACHGALTVEDAASVLRCEQCGRGYPVRENIPVLLIEDASPPTSGAVGTGPEAG